jgi:hypothetical protein
MLTLLTDATPEPDRRKRQPPSVKRKARRALERKRQGQEKARHN